MGDSILNTIKSLRGIADDYDVFDRELIAHINTALMILEQAGVGVYGFSITGPNEVWSDFLPTGKSLEGVKTYISQKVQVLFDPPQNGTLMNAIESSLSELVWRLNLEVDP